MNEERSVRATSKILIALLVFGIAGFLSMFFVTPAETDVDNCISCPHENFLSNHVCTTCTTTTDAADFSKYVNADNPRKVNTVFYGRPSFEPRTYISNRCGMTVAVPTASCKRMAGSSIPPKYTCTYLGECLAEHSTANGHLFHDEMRCNN